MPSDDEIADLNYEIISQLAEKGWAEVNVNGFVVRYDYPRPEHLTWPWDVFYKLVEQHVGGDALWDVLEMYRVSVFGS